MNILNNKGNGGIGFLGLLTIVFITLKLLGTISWSWWLVLSPLYGGIIIWFIFAILVFLFMMFFK